LPAELPPFGGKLAVPVEDLDAAVDPIFFGAMAVVVAVSIPVLFGREEFGWLKIVAKGLRRCLIATTSALLCCAA